MDAVPVNKRVREYAEAEADRVNTGFNRREISADILAKNIALTQSLYSKLRINFKVETFGKFIEGVLQKTLIPKTNTRLVFQRRKKDLCVNWELAEKYSRKDKVSEYTIRWLKELYDMVYDE